jgi:hypothetical protein
MDYTPEERKSYELPAVLPEGVDICLDNTPSLAELSDSLAQIPWLPEFLWAHEVFGPVLFDLSLTDTRLKVMQG